MSRWWGYPWYDSKHDRVARVKLRSPWGWELDANPLSLRWLRWMAWGLLAFLLLLICFLLVRAYLRRERGSSLSPSSAARNVEQEQLAKVDALPPEVHLDLNDLLGAAGRQYRAGNYAQAVIYLFSHQLVQLDRGHLIRLARGKTNRQYLKEIDRRPALKQLVERTMVTFEQVFFGNRTLSREAFESLWTEQPTFDRLLAQEVS